MTSKDGAGGKPGSADVVVPDHVVTAAQVGAVAKESTDQKPMWLDKFAWSALWKAVAVVLLTLFFLGIAWRAQTLLRMLAVSVFFGIAMIPAVNYLHKRWGVQPQLSPLRTQRRARFQVRE